MMYGWTGTILRVNLSARTVSKEPLRADWARDYIGGRGLGAKYLLDEVDPQVDPFSPTNKLLFVTGPLTGTNASCGARYMVVTSGGRGGPTATNSGRTARPEGPPVAWPGDGTVVLTAPIVTRCGAAVAPAPTLSGP